MLCLLLRDGVCIYIYVDISDTSQQILCSISTRDNRINSDAQGWSDYLEKNNETPDLRTA